MQKEKHVKTMPLVTETDVHEMKSMLLLSRHFKSTPCHTQNTNNVVMRVFYESFTQHCWKTCLNRREIFSPNSKFRLEKITECELTRIFETSSKKIK